MGTKLKSKNVFHINLKNIHVFKMDRLQIVVVAKKYISVLQLFISRMPKMCAIP